MATAPPTDRRQSDFLEGAQFAVCPYLRKQWYNKKERFADEASMFSFIRKPFLYFF